MGLSYYTVYWVRWGATCLISFTPILYLMTDMCGLSLLVVSSQYHLFGTGTTFRKKIGVTLFGFQPTSPRVVSLPGWPFRTGFLQMIDLSCLVSLHPHVVFFAAANHDHLFFNCPFTAQVWDSISAKLNVQWQAHSLSDWVTLLSSFKGKTLRVTTIKLATFCL